MEYKELLNMLQAKKEELKQSSALIDNMIAMIPVMKNVEYSTDGSVKVVDAPPPEIKLDTENVEAGECYNCKAPIDKLKAQMIDVRDYTNKTKSGPVFLCNKHKVKYDMLCIRKEGNTYMIYEGGKNIESDENGKKIK